MPTPPITVELDVRAIRRFQKRVERYQGLPLAQRMQKGTLEAARLLVPAVRSAAPKGPTGNLKRRVTAKQHAFRGTFTGRTKTMDAVVTSTAPHRHLVIQGHRVVTPGGRDTGKRSIPNPFIDRAATPRAAEAMRVVSRAIFGEG